MKEREPHRETEERRRKDFHKDVAKSVEEASNPNKNVEAKVTFPVFNPLGFSSVFFGAVVGRFVCEVEIHICIQVSELLLLLLRVS